MGQVLYRKHRPKTLKEVVGQEHITTTLGRALKQGRISHAYLLTGPRGVGKTSIARILAHEINDLPYTDDSMHIDIVEIDAASNRRIDEIRDLRDKVHIAPTSAKYKVYIIDEVHMLTKEAFNALLKTLEEPPAHVIFILATTDAHKLPETIVSRTQRYSFKPVAKAKVIDHLRELAATEKIKTDDAALELLAEHGEGSFRDSISLLDQASSHGQALTADTVHTLLGIPPTQSLHNVYELLGRADGAGLIEALEGLYGQGFQAAAIAKQLGKIIRQQVVDGSSHLSQATALDLLAELLAVPTAHDPERFLEITLLRTIQPSDTSISRPITPVESSVKVEAKPGTPDPTEPVDSPPPPPASNELLNEAIWPEVLTALKQKHNTLYGVVRMAEPDFSTAGTLRLAFGFGFHQKRLKENGNQQILTDIIRAVSGQTVYLDCVLDKAAQPPQPTIETPTKAPESGELSAISNIFGGAELLES